MSNIDSLNTLIAPAYLARATKAAKARRWVEAAEDITRYSSLLPKDYRAPLLLAKIRLREGQLAECLTALEDARQLGHDISENKRMNSWVCNQDRRRHDRLIFRKNVIEQSQLHISSVGKQVYLICWDFWTKCSAHVLYAILIILTLVLHSYLVQPL